MGNARVKLTKKMHLLFNPLQFLLVPSQAFLTTCYMSVCKSGLFGGVGCFSHWFSPFFGTGNSCLSLLPTSLTANEGLVSAPLHLS